MQRPCKVCRKPFMAYSTLQNKCFTCTKKHAKPLKQRGKRTIEYEKWRDEVAKPYLDANFGHVCAKCGKGDYGLHILDVDHKKGRGSHPQLKMVLSNVQWLGRVPCHRDKTDGKL